MPSFCPGCDAADFLFPFNDRCQILPEDQVNAHAYYKLSTWKISDALECPICSLAVKLYTEVDLKGLPTAGKKITFWARRILSMTGGAPDSRWCPDLEIGFSVQPNGNITSPEDFASLRKVEMVMPDDVLLYSYFRRRTIPSVADPAELREWLQSCRYNHWHPKTGSNALMDLVHAGNFRLLDTDTLRFKTVADRTPLPAYAALSYVWGLESGNRFAESPTTEISLESLAPTLRDAILMTRTLELPYIWIDQLCVDRSSSLKLHETLVNMGTIYECAQIVLVAACSDSAEKGLPGSPSTPRKEEPVLAAAINDIDEELRIVASRAMGSGVNLLSRQPWSRRGWTFQEFALARRSLVILPDEIMFVCGTGIRREAYSTTRPPELLYPAPPELHLRYEQFDPIRKACNTSDSGFTFSGYAAAVLEYTSRELTFEGDRLRAFSGFVSKMAPRDRVATRSGLPLLYLGDSLTWNANEWVDRGSRLNVARERCYGEAPSWSWAFVPYPTCYNIISNAAECPAFHYQSYREETDISGIPDRYFGTKLLRHSAIHFDSVIPPDYCFKRSSLDWHALPVIHLMTVLFEAKLERIRHDGSLPGLKHFGFTGYGQHTSSSQTYAHRGRYFILDEEEFASSNAKGVVSCAVVWAEQRPAFGELHFCVFLLRKLQDYYGRAGSAMVASEDFFAVINAPESNARWEYIRLR